MKSGGAICCLWLGLCASPCYGQHLPKLPPSAANVESQTVPAAYLQSNAAPIAFVLNVPTRAFKLDRSPIAPGLPQNSTLYQAIHPPSPEAVCTQPVLAKVAQSSDNAFDHLDFSAAAIGSAFTHENLVKMAHNFIPGRTLPDAPSYVPLTTQQKFDLFLRRSHSGAMLVDVLSDSLYSQATGAYPRFGGGMKGYGHRFGASAAGAEAGAFFSGFVFPALLHQDSRYFPSRQDDISDRLAYAASRVIIGRSDNGRTVFNWSLILSQFTQAALSNAYIPYRNETVGGTVENALANLGGIAEWNILTEFWPDIKAFLGKHRPKPMHRGQQKPSDINSSQIAQK
jgi:hypothetical protein